MYYVQGRYYPIPRKYLHTELEIGKYNEEFRQYLDEGVYVEGKVINNLYEDLTIELQRIINNNQVVILSNREINIHGEGLRLNSNKILIFQDRTKLKSIPNSKTHFAVLIVDEFNNVKVFNAKISG